MTAMEDTTTRLSLRSNFSWTFVGNVVYAVSEWGMLALLTKLGTPEMVGQFSLGLAVQAPILAFATLKTRLVIATDTEDEYVFGDYLALRILMNLLGLLVIASIIVFSGYSWDTARIVLVVTLAKIVDSLSDVFYGLFQQQERMDFVGKSRIIRGPLSLVVLGILLYATGRLFWAVLGLAATWGIVFVGYDIVNGGRLLRSVSAQTRALRPRWHLQTMLQLAWLALPLGVVVALEALKTNMPRYFLAQYVGEYELGIFTPMAYLKQVGNLFAIALGLAAVPRMAQYYASDQVKAYRSLLAKLVGFGILLGVGAVFVSLVAGKQVLTLLYDAEYAQYAHLLTLLMVAAGLDYVATFLDYGMTSARYLKAQIPLFTVIVVVTTIACFVLIPTYGVDGAAWAVVISSIIRVLGSLVIIWRVLKAQTVRRLHQEEGGKIRETHRSHRPSLRSNTRRSHMD